MTGRMAQAGRLVFLSLAFLAGCKGDVVDPAVLTSLLGNSPTTLSATAGAAVDPAPSVIAKDQRGDPMPGVPVTFAVVTGGGSVTGAAVVTNSSGVATVGSWILGGMVGSNTLSASSGTLAPVTFTATATENPACTMPAVHSFGTTSQGTLEAADCRLAGPDDFFVDFYSVLLPAAEAYLFTETSSVIDSYLILMAGDGTAIAENDDASQATRNSAIKALLPPGNYLLVPGAFEEFEFGPYSLTSASTSAVVTDCEEVFVVRGIATTQSVQTTDCEVVPNTFGDLFIIFLAEGQQITASMESSTVDSFMELYDSSQMRVAFNDNREAATQDARITHTAAVTGYYFLVARAAAAAQTGNYTLTIQ